MCVNFIEAHFSCLSEVFNQSLHDIALAFIFDSYQRNSVRHSSLQFVSPEIPHPRPYNCLAFSQKPAGVTLEKNVSSSSVRETSATAGGCASLAVDTSDVVEVVVIVG